MPRRKQSGGEGITKVLVVLLVVFLAGVVGLIAWKMGLFKKNGKNGKGKGKGDKDKPKHGGNTKPVTPAQSLQGKSIVGIMGHAPELKAFLADTKAK